MTQNDQFIKEKELIIARLEIVSPNLHFFEGSDDKSYSRDDMIRLIRNGDPIGLDFIKTEFEFLRALKTGEILRTLNSTR
jgi:hypothetical protein